MKIKVIGVRPNVHYDFSDGKTITGRNIYYMKTALQVDGFVSPHKPLFLNDTYYKDMFLKPNDDLNVEFNESGHLVSCERCD